MISTILGQGGDEACYRVISPAYASTPLSGMGAARQGGRFNRPDQEALYLSLDESTALAEYKQDNPWLRPGTICTFFINGLHVADLSAGFDSERWPPLWVRFCPGLAGGNGSTRPRSHQPGTWLTTWWPLGWTASSFPPRHGQAEPIW